MGMGVLPMNELERKLARAAEALENIRLFEPDPYGPIDQYIVLRLTVKRLAGDALIDIGALKVGSNGRAQYNSSWLDGKTNPSPSTGSEKPPTSK